MRLKLFVLSLLMCLMAGARPLHFELNGRKLDHLSDHPWWVYVGDLDLTFNNLDHLPSWVVQRWARLRALNLGSNDFETLPPELLKLKGLRRLSLRMNSLSELDPRISQMTGLLELDLAGTGLTRLPQSLGRLAGLQRLDLSGNGLLEVPASLGDLSHLTVLDLAENGLTRLPALGKCVALRRLVLRENNLKFLPAQWRQLKALEQLDLSGNNLGALPEDITNLPRLRELNLINNPIHAFPKGLRSMHSLKLLYLDSQSLPLLELVELQRAMPWTQIVPLRASDA